MKKILLVLGLILVVGACLLMFFFNSEKLTPENSAGKTIYYTMITGLGVQDENGRYNYELTSYNEKGKEKKLGFSAGKQLREGAYVQLYNTLIRGVTYWEEVTFEELPEAVQQQYQK
ncbi:YxeA family protein [Paenibacillus profundus]|uniref:YxeA family protein n=1 Tax=Paenibacillus profundus TaxID=1173085 RepID=A0ABS8YCU6_9BACL|nr:MULTISPECIES: YxeA family protein [Paenibacillus]MCE5169841.1 YxeA family protein [Paenibacillus profundus]MCM3342141.1 YxeA family protein [Paenibacillus sp. MER TA 81-3]